MRLTAAAPCRICTGFPRLAGKSSESPREGAQRQRDLITKATFGQERPGCPDWRLLAVGVDYTACMRRVFITGASSGLGAGLARGYAKANSVLGLLARRRERLEALKSELEGCGAQVQVYPVDVRDTRAVLEVARDFLDHANGIDLVIANAGVGLSTTSGNTYAERVAQLMETNVVGVTNTVLPFVNPMCEAKHGVLAAMGSIAGFRALPGQAPYSASKACVHTYMDGLRMDLYGTGVHAMTLCPGFVRTPMTDQNSFSMPFMLEVDQAVTLMQKAIENRRETFAFPWQFRSLAPVLRYAPLSVIRQSVKRLVPRVAGEPFSKSVD